MASKNTINMHYSLQFMSLHEEGSIFIYVKCAQVYAVFTRLVDMASGVGMTQFNTSKPQMMGRYGNCYHTLIIISVGDLKN